MKKWKLFLTVCLQICFVSFSFSQDKWDLKRSVEYALANNISVKQADVQARIAALNLNQSRLTQIPTLGFDGSLGLNAGRTQNPFDFSVSNESNVSGSFSLSSSVTLFNWFRIRNTIAANRLEAEASKTNIDKVKNDISLNVAAAYLQALLNKEQVSASELQVKLTLAQLENTRKLVIAGSVPELNAAELEAQLARDSATLVGAQQTAAVSLLQMQALLNLDAAQPFDITSPPVELIPVEPLSELQPESVFQLAVANMPLQRVNQLRVQAANKNVAATRGAMMPAISAYGRLGTAYNNKLQEVYGRTPYGGVDSSAFVSIANQNYKVYAPFVGVNNLVRTPSFFSQMDKSFGQSIGLSLAVPIFNQGQLRTQHNRAKLDLRNVELQQELDNQTLKQDIYKAYTDATASFQKYIAGIKSVETSQKAFDFATKRYNIGLLNTIDLLTNQNNLFKAKIDKLTAQYDYVFKLKVLEFYKGNGIKL
jgi:outer membrane protein